MTRPMRFCQALRFNEDDGTNGAIAGMMGIQITKQPEVNVWD